MNTYTFISNIISATPWPVFILCIFVFLYRKMGDSFLKMLVSIPKNRKVTAKYGKMEIEIGEVKELRRQIEIIANEPDPKIRLELAQNALRVEDAIKSLKSQDYDFLLSYKKQSACFITWYYGMNEKEKESYDKLSKLRLIHRCQSTGEESLDYITPLGEEVIDKLSENNA